MELRMNRDAHEEYEEVESPFAPSSHKTASGSKLRTKKNVFNRPFAAETSTPPAVFETTSRRRAHAHPDETDLIQHRSSELADADIGYLEGEEEEEETETRPARVSPRAQKKTKVRKNILAKIGWSAIALLILRLICMDRGVWDYFTTEGSIREKHRELKSIQDENKSLRTEIVKIQSDRNYQRQLAKEHLGVIAADEFLILFAGETPDVTTTKPNTSL
ncbi:MAG: FtsB family cell division protein [Bacteriovoracaceae bacterium]